MDDYAPFRTLVATVLSDAGYEVREAANGQEAVASAHAEWPLAVVLDVCLPDISGYEVCRRLRDEYRERLPILFVSGKRTDSLDRVAGLLVGADDYLVKPFAPGELIARMRLATRPRALPTGNGHHLTPREREVLCLLAAGMGSREIAERLVVSPKTVGGHIERIIGKLGVHSRAQAVAAAYREGLVS